MIVFELDLSDWFHHPMDSDSATPVAKHVEAARVIVEKYYGKLTLDFQVNKKITEEWCL